MTWNQVIAADAPQKPRLGPTALGPVIRSDVPAPMPIRYNRNT